ncbi:hypothetical protein FQR65_LT10096 [Abscondita terminalis]|nr:hypothetical protein FQR65_LT10096 [Abscondita terminalis]
MHLSSWFIYLSPRSYSVSSRALQHIHNRCGMFLGFEKSADEQMKSAKDMYPVKTHRSTERNLNEAELERFQQDLNTFGSTITFTWLLRDEPQDGGLVIPAVEDKIFSANYITSTDKRQYLLQKMSVTSDKIKEIADATVGQSANENWLTYRKNRLTASHFRIAIKAINRNKYPISLFRQLTGDINSTHPYYHQIQGSLHITGRQMCYLMVWTHLENIIMEVPVDPEWVINITKLQEFYINLYIEHIIDNFRE